MKQKISDLIPDDQNFNLGNEFGESLIEKSFSRFGAGRSILLDKNNRVIAGNKSLQKFAEQGGENVLIVETTGEEIVAVKRTDIDLDTKHGREMALADNATAKANITWDGEAILEWDMPAEEWGIDFSHTIDAAEPREDSDEVPEPPDIPDSEYGKVYQLGRHRLMCGDATEASDIAVLMNNQKPDLLFTDMPYGISIVQNSSVGGGGALKFGGIAGKHVESTKGFAEIIGDDTTETARISYQLCRDFGIENFILWGGNYFTDFLPPSMGWIVWWKKNTGNFADFEMAWTSYHKASRLYEFLWNGLSRQGDRKSELVKRVHPTQKPVGLLMSILEDYDAELVLDLFGGSGSTLIACEQMERTCLMMELSPSYCDVIRQRYHTFVTGNEEGWKEATAEINGNTETENQT